MRESSLVPTNLLGWPRCDSLLPDQRLILLWLWSAPFLNCGGFGEIPLRGAASTLGLDPAALLGGIMTLQQNGLLIYDQATGEIFLTDWFRFHKFKTTLSRQILQNEFLKLQSEQIKSTFLNKSMACFPTPTLTSTSNNFSEKVATAVVKKLRRERKTNTPPSAAVAAERRKKSTKPKPTTEGSVSFLSTEGSVSALPCLSLHPEVREGGAL